MIYSTALNLIPKHGMETLTRSLPIHLFVLCSLLIYIQLSIKFNLILYKCLKRRRYQDFKSLYKVDISRQLLQIDCTEVSRTGK